MLSSAKIRSLVEANFEVVPARSNEHEITIICGLCRDTTGNRGVSLATGKTNCWLCGNGGSLKAYAYKVGVELDLHGDDVQGASLDEIEEALLDLEEPAATGTLDTLVTEVALPKGFTELTYDGTDGYHRLAAAMARRKHLTLDDLVTAYAGVAPGNHDWEPYVIFPVHEWGRVVYYQGRTMIDPYGGTTKKFPSRNELPRGSRYWLGGIDELRQTGGIVVLVESILNRLSLKREFMLRNLSGYVPIVVFRHKLSREQLSKLTRCRGITEVVFLYDADATASADAEARSVINRFPRVTVAEMPDGDANDDAALAVDRIMARRAPRALALELGE